MNVTNIVIGTALLIDLGYGLIVYGTNRKRTLNQHFLTLSLVIGFWVFCVWMALNATTESQAGLWIRQASGSGILVITVLGFLRLAIKYQGDTWLQTIIRSRWAVLGCLLILLLCQTPFFMQGVRLPPVEPGELGVASRSYGYGFALFNGYALLFLSILVYFFARDLHQSSGMRRVEVQFVMLGCGGAIVMGTMLSVVIPLIANTSRTSPFAPFSVILLDFVIAYGIATHRIMGVAAAIQRATGFVLLLAYLTVVYFVVRHGSVVVLKPMGGNATDLSYLLAAVVTAISVAPAHGRMQRFAQRLIRTEVTDVGRIAQQAGRALQSITTLDKLLELFSDIVRTSIGTERVVVLLAGNNGFAQACPLGRGPRSTSRRAIHSFSTCNSTANPWCRILYPASGRPLPSPGRPNR